MKWIGHLRATNCANSWTGQRISWLTLNIPEKCLLTRYLDSLSNIGKEPIIILSHNVATGTAILLVHRIFMVLLRVSDFHTNSKNRFNAIGFFTNFVEANFRVRAKIAVVIAVVHCERYNRSN